MWEDLRNDRRKVSRPQAKQCPKMAVNTRKLMNRGTQNSVRIQWKQIFQVRGEENPLKIREGGAISLILG